MTKRFYNSSSVEYPLTRNAAPHVTSLELLARQALDHAERGNADGYSENFYGREAVWTAPTQPDGSRSAVHVRQERHELQIETKRQQPRVMVDGFPFQTTIASTLKGNGGEISVYETGHAPETHPLDEIQVAQVMQIMGDVLTQAGVVLDTTPPMPASH